MKINNKKESEEVSRPLKRLKRSLTVENLWVYILSLLNKKDAHAYGIFNDMEKRYGIKSGLVTPYVVLYKLEEDKYIEGYDSGRRRYYKITEKGKDLLKKAKRELKEIIEKLE